jgi:hypothetical protein
MTPEARTFAKDVLLPLLTLLFSGIVATVVSYWLNKQSQRRELLRTKLEEAYIACDEYCNSLGGHYLGCFALFKGEIDINQFNENTIAQAVGADKTAFRRLEMTVHIYVPDALPHLRTLVQLRDNLAKLRTAHRGRFLNGERATPDLIPQLQKEISSIDTIEVAIKDAITRATRRL